LRFHRYLRLVNRAKTKQKHVQEIRDPNRLFELSKFLFVFSNQHEDTNLNAYRCHNDSRDNQNRIIIRLNPRHILNVRVDLSLQAFRPREIMIELCLDREQVRLKFCRVGFERREVLLQECQLLKSGQS